MIPSRPPLGERAEAVFDALLDERADDLHPADRAEAAAFWDWLGEQPRPLAQAAPLPVQRRRVGRLLAAAALVLGIGVGAVAWQRSATESVATTRYAAGQAERRVIRLDDGSTVTLAADSAVSVRFTPAERHLQLDDGEALFEVAHDIARPFVVETPHGAVTAVGTAFDVALGREAAEVTVVEGTIRIALPRDVSGETPGNRAPIAQLAHRGERFAFGSGLRGTAQVGFISRSAPVDADTATAWTRGQLVFRGEPLSAVVEAVNRYAADPTDRLVVTDPAAARTPVFGIVDQGDPGAVRDLIADPRAVAPRREPPDPAR